MKDNKLTRVHCIDQTRTYTRKNHFACMYTYTALIIHIHLLKVKIL